MTETNWITATAIGLLDVRNFVPSRFTSPQILIIFVQIHERRLVSISFLYTSFVPILRFFAYKSYILMDGSCRVNDAVYANIRSRY